MEIVCSFEALAPTDESARNQNPEEQNYPHRRENHTLTFVKWPTKFMYVLKYKVFT